MIADMITVLISLFFFGALVPFSAEAEFFEEITNNANGTTPNIVMLPIKGIVRKPEEKVLIDQFRKTYSDLLTDQYLNCDAFIGGLLEGNKWSLLDASKHLKRILSWRASNKIDELNYEEPPVDLLERFPWRSNATTYNGCPIVEVLWGRWLISDYMQSQEFVRDAVKTFSRHTDQMYERGRWGTKKLAPKCQHASVVADAKGFLMKNIAETNALNAVIRMALVLNDKYTNLADPIIVINAPEDFLILMKTMLPFLGLAARAYYIYSENEAHLARKHFESYADISSLSLITWPEYTVKTS